MAIVLPLAANGILISSAVLVAFKDGYPIFVSTLHQIGNKSNFQIVIPPHNGQVTATQVYPIVGDIPALDVDLIKSDPIYDLSFFKGRTTELQAPIPNILANFNDVNVGEEMLILGYPYSTLGSTLETTEISHISAKGRRLFMNRISIDELIISHQTLQGSSGSAVIRRSDGILCGIIRGSLTPPNVISIGDIPIASDSSVTYCTFSSVITQHLNHL